MPLDRVVIGEHANSDIGSGLFVSQIGANVMHPEHAQFGNLMFDSSEPHATLQIIQTGTFKITCKRKAFSPRGNTIGTRPSDSSPTSLNIMNLYEQEDWNEWLISAAHTFTVDTGRPASLTAVANNLFGQDPWAAAMGAFQGGAALSHGAKVRTKQGNYLDTGSHTIAIDTPLPDGEIPEVALRFAIGTDGTYLNPHTDTIGPTFHPWYANTKTTGDGGSWSDIDYAAYNSGSANSQQIVHMDSNWMRLKWGGLGAEEYRGTQEEYSWESLMDFFGGDADAIAHKFGFASAEIAEEKISTNSKLLSLALTNAQGVVGLIPYANSTHIHVDGYMTPTHAGLRQPVDRTFQLNAGVQKGIGFNAIDDFAHINFPIEDHPHTNKFWVTDATYSNYNGELGKWMIAPKGLYASWDASHYSKWYEIVKNRLHAKLFKELPAIPEAGAFNTTSSKNIYNISSRENVSLPINEPDHGKRDMYGWGGHPTEFFVNPFSNDTLTFYTHMQPPYIENFGVTGFEDASVEERSTTFQGYHYVGQYLPLNFPNEAGQTGTPYKVLFSDAPHTQGPTWSYSLNSPPDSFYVGVHDYNLDDSPEGGGTLLSRGDPNNRQDGWEVGALATWGPMAEATQGIMDAETNAEYWYRGAPNYTRSPPGVGTHDFDEADIVGKNSVLGSIPTYDDIILGDGQNQTDLQGGTPGAGYTGLWGTAWAPMHNVYNGAAIKWPPGHQHADFLDHRDWIGSMGLGGAGSKESLASVATVVAENIGEEVGHETWDTFYVSYVVYSTGSVPPSQAQAMGAGASSATPAPTNKAAEKKSVNVWDAYWGSRKQGKVLRRDNPSIINNFVFPDDLVGTVEDPDTDPFAGNRDPSGKIYGNMHFDLVFDEGKNYGSDKFDPITNIPLPAITLDFSESKWNFNNNNDSVSLSIQNSARIVGGGGSGGVGIRRTVTKDKAGDISDAAHGGGGGGAGGGTGRNPNEQTMIGSTGYNGTGWGGDGWAQGLLNDLGEFKYGDPGTIGSEFKFGGTGGAKALQVSTENIDAEIRNPQVLYYGPGGDGGDVFHVKHPSTIQPLIGIKNSGTGIIIAGGGAGAGGYELDGGDGGSYGTHGQSTYGLIGYWGGNPGYIVSSPSNTYKTPVKITNIGTNILIDTETTYLLYNIFGPTPAFGDPRIILQTDPRYQDAPPPPTGTVTYTIPASVSESGTDEAYSHTYSTVESPFLGSYILSGISDLTEDEDRGGSWYSHHIAVSFGVEASSGIVQGRNPELSSHEVFDTTGGIAGGWLLEGVGYKYYRGATQVFSGLAGITLYSSDPLRLMDSVGVALTLDKLDYTVSSINARLAILDSQN